MALYEFAGKYPTAEEASKDCVKRAWDEGLRRVRFREVKPLSEEGFYSVTIKAEEPERVR